MPLVTFGWGGKGWYDPATGKTTPLTNAPVVPAYPPPTQDRGTFTIVQPTNATPVPRASIASGLALSTQAPETYPFSRYMTAQKSYDLRQSPEYAWLLSQWEFQPEEAAWFLGGIPDMPESLKQFYPEGE